VNAQPLFQFDELHFAHLVEVNQEGEGLKVVELQQISVDLQKSCRHSNGNPLVSSNERMGCDKLSQSAAAS
jgi:hypothetical protein